MASLLFRYQSLSMTPKDEETVKPETCWKPILAALTVTQMALCAYTGKPVTVYHSGGAFVICCLEHRFLPMEC
jgi:hypothetical protein